MLDILGFLIHVFERYSIYFVFDELLFEFLSFMEFNFAKIVEMMANPYMMMGLQHAMMPPAGAWAALRAAADLFGRV